MARIRMGEPATVHGRALTWAAEVIDFNPSRTRVTVSTHWGPITFWPDSHGRWVEVEYNGASARWRKTHSGLTMTLSKRPKV